MNEHAGCVSITLGGDAVTRVELSGELDHSNNDNLLQAFEGLREHSRRVTIADSGLSFIGIEIAATLAEIVQQMVDGGVEVELSLSHAPLRSILRLGWPAMASLLDAEDRSPDIMSVVEHSGRPSYEYSARTARESDHWFVLQAIGIDIELAVVEGLLPEQWTYEVGPPCSSPSHSIDIQISDCPDGWITRDDARCAGDLRCHDGSHALPWPERRHLTAEAEAACLTLHRIRDVYVDGHDDPWSEGPRVLGSVTVQHDGD